MLASPLLPLWIEPGARMSQETNAPVLALNGPVVELGYLMNHVTRTDTRTGLNARRLLAGLRDVMAGSEDAEHRLGSIVRLIAEHMHADVCSCYVMRAGDILELFATVGLNPQAVHRTRLRTGEGIVGDIAAHARALAIADAHHHPSFAYRPETGEDPYNALMGVPILRGGRVRGVLVIQHRDSRHYDDEEIELLETIAMVVAELITSGSFLGAQESARVGDPPFMPFRLDGTSLSAGLAMGVAVLHRQQFSVRHMFADDPETEVERLRVAVHEMHTAIDAMAAGFGGEPLDILETYRMIAEDRGWLSRIREAVHSGLTAEAAVIRVQNDTRARLTHVSDPMIRDRLLDFDDLAHRLLQHLAGRSSIADGIPLPDDVILVARSLGPAELLDYDRARLRGVVLAEGSPFSHVTILARALAIPVVGRVANLLSRVDPLDTLLVDGQRGHIYIRPSDEVRTAFAESIRSNAIREQTYAEVRSLPAITQDRVPISIRLNCGLLIDLPHLDASGADGIGLFRTEIPFMVYSTFPDVDTQTDLYKAVLDEAGHRPVAFRTLDIGGDKKLPYFSTEHEENPAMGWRAIRIGLDRPAMLRQQLRALLRAAWDRPLSIMFPMVATVAEFDASDRILAMELARAEAAGQPTPSPLRVGVMLEIPALLQQLPTLLSRVDFVAVGSNDLFQYMFACDRSNPRLARRYDPLSPPFLNALRGIAEACNRKGVPLSVCGEMAGQPLDAMALIGLGYRTLSMAPPAAGPVKSMVRKLHVAALESYLQALSDCRDNSVRDRLEAFARDHGVPI